MPLAVGCAAVTVVTSLFAIDPELIDVMTVDGVQTSSRYPAGMPLRFARVLRYRPDNRADGDDMVEDVRRLRVALLTDT